MGLIEVPGFGGYYFVDEDGNIFSVRRTMRPKKLSSSNHKGRGRKCYLRVKIGGSAHLVHRIVASAKIGRPLTREEVVNHIDGDTQNNNLNNLEVTSHYENVQHAVANRLYCHGPDWYKARSEMLGTARTFND